MGNLVGKERKNHIFRGGGCALFDIPICLSADLAVSSRGNSGSGFVSSNPVSESKTSHQERDLYHGIACVGGGTDGMSSWALRIRNH